MWVVLLTSNPFGLIKWELTAPNSFAFSFIISEKASTLPATDSAIITEASLAEKIITAFITSSAETVSPALTPPLMKALREVSVRFAELSL